MAQCDLMWLCVTVSFRATAAGLSSVSLGSVAVRHAFRLHTWVKPGIQKYTRCLKEVCVKILNGIVPSSAIDDRLDCFVSV